MIKNKQNTQLQLFKFKKKTFCCLDNSNHKVLNVRKGVRLPSLFKSEIQNVRMEFYENKAKSQSESGQMKKMSQTAIVNFEIFYKIKFTCAIRGDHVYKTSWTPVLKEKLECKKDNREEALSHDKHLVGVFKRDGTLVGHVPIEISRIMDYVMQNNEKNFVSATVVGSRKREIGLVVPAKFSAYAADRRVTDILSKAILKIKTKYSHFDVQYEEDKKLCKRSYLLEKEKS